jgi:FKBP-type peptidyl-prolyl cis-trans isomerase
MAKEEKKEVKKEKPKKAESKAIKCTTIFPDGVKTYLLPDGKGVAAKDTEEVGFNLHKTKDGKVLDVNV